MADGKVGLEIGINVNDKGAQSKINKLQAGLATLSGLKAEIKADVVGGDVAAKRLDELIDRFSKVRKIGGQKIDISNLIDIQNIGPLIDNALKTATGRAKTQLKELSDARNELLRGWQVRVDRALANRSVSSTVNKRQAVSRAANENRELRIRDIESNLATARQTGDLRAQISLLKQKRDLLQSINRANRNNVHDGEIAKLNKEIKALNEKRIAIRNSSKALREQGDIFSNLKNMAARYFSIYTVANFAKKIAETTGYFQQQQVALEGILGSASKAKSVLNEIKSFAIQSPFQTKELVTFTKQLAAFGVKNNDLFPTVKKLADISAGLGVDMSRIILAYGQVKSAAVLRGQELRQFTEAGIPMVQALADKFTDLNGKLVTTGEVFKLISERKVPFEMVASVLSDMTAEGGKFYKMQENITNTTYGQIQKLKDLWTIAMDDMGKEAGPMINAIIKGLQSIVKNIKPISTALGLAFAGRAIGKFVQDAYRVVKALQLMKFTVAATRGALASIGGAIGIAVGAITGFIINADRKNKELANSMKETADSYVKDTQRMIEGLDSLSKKISTRNIGSKQYSDAIDTLAANYGDFVSADKLEQLRDIGGEAYKVALGFDKIAESIKEAIRQQNIFLALEAQGNTAASAAQTNASDSAKNSGGISLLGQKADILSYLETYTTQEGMVRTIAKTLPGIKSFLSNKNNKGLTKESLRNSIGDIIGQAVYDMANEGIELKAATKYRMKIRIQDAILKVYGLDKTTVKQIVDNFFENGGIDEKSYNAAVANYAAAGSTIYSKIQKPFKEAEKQITTGRYEKKESLVIDDKISAEQETADIWREALKLSLENANLTKYEGSLLQKTINDTSKTSHDIQVAMKDFERGLLPDEMGNLSIIRKMYEERSPERSGHAERIFGLFTKKGSTSYKWREDEDLSTVVNTYGSPTDATFEKLRGDLQDEISKTRKALDEMSKGPEYKADRDKLQKVLNALLVLKGDKYYGIEEKKQKGGGSGGGWQRFLADLFSYIKEARAEEKKLVDNSAGLTEDLANQINSEQLEGTAVDAFWTSMQKGGSPFKKLIDKMDEYGIESTFFSKDFLQGALSDIVTNAIKSTGTVDFQNVWSQLIQVINKRADELIKNPATKKLGESIKAYGQQMTIEGEKFFSRDQVQKLIEDQLRELRKINGQFENLRNTQNAINSIRGASNAYRAYNALGSRGYVSGADVTQRQLQTLLGAKGGKGLSLATPLAQLINGGSVGIASISQILAIKQSLAGITTKEMQGDDEAARQANFDEFQGVIGQFDQLLGQLVTDIEEDFKRLMASKDPAMKASDEIINAFDEYSKALELIDRGIENGDIKKDDADKMAVQAIQNLYESIAKGLSGNGMQDYINRLYKKEGTDSGISNLGFGVGMWLNQGSLADKYGNIRGKELESRKQDLDYELERGYITQEEYDNALADATKKAADETLKFAAKMKLTGDIISKVDSYIQKSAQFANKMIDALEAHNGLTTDEYGNYTYESDYSTAKEAINMISEFSAGISGAFQSLLSGDIFGAITGIGSTIAGFFEDLFGIGDSQIQKQQDKLASSNKSLERALNKLEHAINDAAGKDKWDNLTEQISNLRNQEKNYNELEGLEKDKKHGDADKAEEFRSKAEEVAYQVEDMVRGIREEILGTADDLSSTLTDSFVEAFRNGTNAARAWRDAVRTYVGDVLKQVLLEKVLAPRIQKIFENLGITEGNTDSDAILAIFSNPEKALKLRNDLYAEGAALQDIFSNLPKPIQEMIAWNSSTSELSGGIQGITEDTARTLEGLSNSMLAQLVLIQRSVQGMSSGGFAQVQLSWFNGMLNLQQQIADNTKSMADVLKNSANDTRRLNVQAH